MKKLRRTLSLISFVAVSSVFLLFYYQRNQIHDIEIIWRDYTSETCHGTLKFEYKINNKGKSDFIDYELIPNETYSLENTSGKMVGILSSLDVQYKIHEQGNKIEIFLFDNTNYERIDDKHYTVDKKEDVVAYELILYDEKENKMFVVLSLDNNFEIDEIKTETEVMKDMRGLNKMLEYCKTSGKDLAYYDSFYGIREKGRNGLVVVSQLSKSYEILMSFF